MRTSGESGWDLVLCLRFTEVLLPLLTASYMDILQCGFAYVHGLRHCGCGNHSLH